MEPRRQTLLSDQVSSAILRKQSQTALTLTAAVSIMLPNPMCAQVSPNLEPELFQPDGVFNPVSDIWNIGRRSVAADYSRFSDGLRSTSFTHINSSERRPPSESSLRPPSEETQVFVASFHQSGTTAFALSSDLAMGHASSGMYTRGLNIDPWRQINSDVVRWSLLANDWDGDGGVPPTADAVQAATSAIRMMRQANLHMPDHFVDGDGLISFGWANGWKRAGLTVFPDGLIALYAGDLEVSLMEADDVPVDEIDWVKFADCVAQLV